MHAVRKHWKVLGLLLAAAAAAAVFAGSAAHGASKSSQITFNMVRSAAAEGAGCLPDASARVVVNSTGPVEVMTVRVRGLPANTEFDFFVIQVPNAPFGLSWYQGDIETGSNGSGTGRFIGRFNIETFIVAPGTAPAPFVHDNAFPDAISNPATRCTRSTSACGSTRPTTPFRRAAPAQSRPSTASTTRAVRC